MRNMSVSPLTGVVCCLLLVSWAAAAEDEDRKLSENHKNEEREMEYFDFYMQESTHSGNH
jgi:hypothetical protein